MSESQLNDFLGLLERALEEPAPATAKSRAGLIRSSKDGIIEVVGMPELALGELLEIGEAHASALVMQIDSDGGLAVVLNHPELVKEGQAARPTGEILRLPAGEALIGRVIDSLGAPLDDAGPIKTSETRPLEQVAPGVMTRASVDTPVQTGILAIDSLIPIGRGQRELIIGDRQTGKTTLAIDTIINQKGQDMICVYVAIGQREGKTSQVVQTLRDHGALEYTVVVSAGASTPAVQQFLAPYAGSAVAEYFLHKGKDVLVVYDDLSKHAVAYRELSLLLRKPPGREAYPGDVFYLHSRLLERAVKLDKAFGGGSITALPIVETQAGDVSAYIPTNVISITDGQIFLDTTLFYRGIRPAVNVGLSVSRVGSAAQTHIMKKISGSVKLDLAQYNELAAFSQFASELDETTKKLLTRGQRTVEALKQKPNQPFALWKEAAILWAAKEGALDATPLSDVGDRIAAFLDEFERKHADLVTGMQDGKELTEEIKKGLQSSLAFFHA